MKILLTGSNGQLGWELLKQANDLGFEIKGVDLPEWDITHSVQVEKSFSEYRPSIIINAAAYTHVDDAETEQDLAFLVNRDAPARLAQLCSDKDIPLIHFSTDYVFDGQKDVPYKETDLPSPLNVYGQSKLDGENLIRSRLDTHIIIRTSWLYGTHGSNFVKTMLVLAKKNQSIQVIDDQFGSPTSTADLSDAVLKILSTIQNETEVDWGTYHYCGQGITSWHGFSQAIFNIAKNFLPLKIKRVEPIPSNIFSAKADRPAFSSLDCTTIYNNFGIDTKPWRKSLEIMINRLLNENQKH
jgi:dTDP-4-dehydrorhamnose reductase